jgi:hypothetical protein
MKKLFVSMAAVLASSSAFAGYGIIPIDRYYVDSGGNVYFGTTAAATLTGTCSYYIDQFRFNGTTPGGKNMLATLAAAKIAGLSVTVWYTDSTVPGTNQTNGCTDSTMAVPTAIGIR